MKFLILLTFFTSAFAQTLDPEDILNDQGLKTQIKKMGQILQEGTETTLTPEQLEEILPWAKSTELRLKSLLSNQIQGSRWEQIDTFEKGIIEVLGDSYPKSTQMLMRFVLTRSLLILQIIKDEIPTHQDGYLDTSLRLLSQSVKLSLEYYKSDLSFLDPNETKYDHIQFATFGKRYSEFLGRLNQSVFDLTAQYRIQRTMLGLLQFDLYRDIDAPSYAPYIKNINDFLKTVPEAPPADPKLMLKMIKQMIGLKKGLQLEALLPDDGRDEILGTQFSDIPAGQFYMGNQSGDGLNFIQPHNVTVQITRPFEMATTEVTQGQWLRYMNSNPSYQKGTELPVYNVSWIEVQAFIGYLNQEAESRNSIFRYRLPSEAEWELTARASSTTTYYFGNDQTDLNKHAWFEGNFPLSSPEYHQSSESPKPVAQLQPNRYGLFDLYGNVGEWVQDSWGPYENAQGNSVLKNPIVRNKSRYRVIKGGNLLSKSEECATGARKHCRASSKSLYTGFRVVREQISGF